MSPLNHDELDRVRFAWPEPLVIELILGHYAGLMPDERQMMAAKLHARILQGFVEGRPTPNDVTPLGSLYDHYRRCGLGADTIAAVSNAVFDELLRIVGMRFRTSPRLREVYSRRLRDALSDVADAGAAKVPPLADPRRARTLRLEPA